MQHGIIVAVSQGDGVGGSVGYTTGWTYNPESQTITERSNHPKVFYWEAHPVNAKAGKADDIAPGMRVASPTTSMRGAFGQFTCNSIFLGITTNVNSISLGDWF